MKDVISSAIQLIFGHVSFAAFLMTLAFLSCAKPALHNSKQSDQKDPQNEGDATKDQKPTPSVIKNQTEKPVTEVKQPSDQPTPRTMTARLDKEMQAAKKNARSKDEGAEPKSKKSEPIESHFVGVGTPGSKYVS